MCVSTVYSVLSPSPVNKINNLLLPCCLAYAGRNLPNPTPDDDIFVHLARKYAKLHPTMHLGKPSCPNDIGKNILRFSSLLSDLSANLFSIG